MIDNATRIENLRQRLSGTRQRAPGTVTTYMDTAGRFLEWLSGALMDRGAVDRYFTWRRDNGISELTLKKEFFHLKKLFEANDIQWPFSGDDAPVSGDDPYQPAFSEAQVNQLILAAPEYTKVERFYLAVSTMYGCRREELSRITKADINQESITIRIAKTKGKKVIRKHLVPDPLRPVFAAYHAKTHTTTALSMMFNRILAKSGLNVGAGYSWHSIRRCLDTLFDYLAVTVDDKTLSASPFWTHSVGWAKTTRGIKHSGAAMAGVYSHPEIISDDPYYNDRLLYPVHPFLRTWGQVINLMQEDDSVTESLDSVTAGSNSDILTPCTTPLDELIKKLKGGL